MEETLYAWRKRMGLCVRCGKRYAFPGYVHCPECIEKSEEAVRRYRENEENRIRQNKRSAERNRKLSRERKEKGLCPRCGKSVRSGNHVYCAQCREKRNAARRAKRSRRPGECFRERIKAGVCMYCGKITVPGYKLCEKCLEKRRIVNKDINLKSSEKWRKEIDAQWNAKRKSSGNG